MQVKRLDLSREGVNPENASQTSQRHGTQRWINGFDTPEARRDREFEAINDEICRVYGELTHPSRSEK